MKEFWIIHLLLSIKTKDYVLIRNRKYVTRACTICITWNLQE